MMKKEELICVFDCETVPDVESLLRVLSQDDINECYDEISTQDEEMGTKFKDDTAQISQNLSTEENFFDNDSLKTQTKEQKETVKKVLNHKKLSLKAMEVFKANSGSDFLPVCFHKVVCISAVMADKFGKFLRVNTIEGENEEEIVAKFINFINAYQPRLVSFNGRGFDLPMLMVRAMRYNISSPAFFEVENREFGKNKWANYRSRYDGRFHLDLLDHISEFKTVNGLKMDNLCATLNLPGKYEVEGSQVLELFYEGAHDKIDEYCQSDTLNTYWLFLKYELLKGNLTHDDYGNYLSVMREYLLDEKSLMKYTEVFIKFIYNELERLGFKGDNS